MQYHSWLDMLLAMYNCVPWSYSQDCWALSSTVRLYAAKFILEERERSLFAACHLQARYATLHHVNMSGRYTHKLPNLRPDLLICDDPDEAMDRGV